MLAAVSAAHPRARWLMVFLPILLFSGCASTPQASRERDADAKEFRTHPATAALFVYRPDSSSVEEDSVLFVGNRLIGATLPGTFFRVDVRPGRHLLHGVAHDAGRLEVEVRPGEIYFVSLRVDGGGSHFALKHAEAGRRELLACCHLLENWAPGQRPLLR
jgi:hypothetical protein